MLTMIIRMTGVTLLYVLLTAGVWKMMNGRRFTLWARLAIGVLYGLCSILSTHFSVDYKQMLLNVRDLGPLIAGLIFDPVAGIIAGLIGGIERYIAGTYWGIGSYTRIACSVSTILAGFLSAIAHKRLFREQKISIIYATLLGAVMEVFHMYVVFITHQSDIRMAFYVVRICALPMILYTGLGLGLSVIVLQLLEGSWVNPFRKFESFEKPISATFELYLFMATTCILTLTLLFSFTIMTRTALEESRNTLDNSTEDFARAYETTVRIMEVLKSDEENDLVQDASILVRIVEESGSFREINTKQLEIVRELLYMSDVVILDRDGNTVLSLGNGTLHKQPAEEVLSGRADKLVTQHDGVLSATVQCLDGALQVTLGSSPGIQSEEWLPRGVSYERRDGTFDLIREDGVILLGVHANTHLSDENIKTILSAPEGMFKTVIFGEEAICRVERMSTGILLLCQIPLSEVYIERDTQMYETVLADILVFAAIYVLVSVLVQKIVVNNLLLVNESLAKITKGDLQERVNVRSSIEFNALSNDINETVDALKGYIDAAEKRIEQELQLARDIQDSALPKNFTFPRQDFELYAAMYPAKEVGGDFYDFFFTDQNNLALVIADVSGKSIPGAMFMMRSKTAIQGFAGSGARPAELLEKANNSLSVGNDAGMFVTAWVGIIDLKTGRMVCANAGHEYPILMRADGRYELYKDKHGLALAAMENMKYREYEIQLEPGDRLFVYTDGIPEAINVHEEQYGTSRLVDVLNSVRNESMKVTIDTLWESITRFSGEADQFDDVTMLGFVYKGSQPDCSCPEKSES